MSLRKKFTTWACLVPLTLSSMTFVGCGAEYIYYVIAAAFGLFYNSNVHNESRREDATYSGTLQFRDVAVNLDVDAELSGAMYLEADGVTFVGMHDKERDITVEINTPGQTAGTWTPADPGMYFRVKVGEDEYMATGDVTVKLKEYVEPGQQLRGTVSGTVVGPNGDRQVVSLEFDATRS